MNEKNNEKLLGNVLSFNTEVKKSIGVLSSDDYVDIESYKSKRFKNFILPKFNADYVIENLYMDSLYSSCVKVLVGDVFKDYRLIGKVVRKVNKVEEFFELSNLVPSLRLAFEDSLSFGYGCVLVSRDDKGVIKRFNHLPSNSIGAVIDSEGNRKFIQHDSKNRIIGYFNIYGEEIEKGVSELLLFRDYYIKDPIFGLGKGVKLAGFIELKEYLDTMVLGTMLKGHVRPQMMVNVKTNVIDDDGQIGQNKILADQLKKVREETQRALNNGLNEGNSLVLSSDSTEILLDIIKLDYKTDSKSVIDIADYIDNVIMKTFEIPATRLTAFKSGVFSGNLTKESLEMYGFNTVLNIQRDFEVLINKFIKDFNGELGKRVGSVEVELERYKTEYSQVEEFDERNVEEVVEDNNEVN